MNNMSQNQMKNRNLKHHFNSRYLLIKFLLGPEEVDLQRKLKLKKKFKCKNRKVRKNCQNKIKLFNFLLRKEGGRK